jgi:hypothetical protein
MNEFEQRGAETMTWQQLLTYALNEAKHRLDLGLYLCLRANLLIMMMPEVERQASLFDPIWDGVIDHFWVSLNMLDDTPLEKELKRGRKKYVAKTGIGGYGRWVRAEKERKLAGAEIDEFTSPDGGLVR